MPSDQELARFWAQVNKHNEDEHPCWEWLGSCNPQGYGVFRGRGAHRIAYQLAHGAIPQGAHIMHTCDNPSCVNPAHLVAGSNRDNQLDSVRKGRYRTGYKLTAAQVVTIRELYALGGYSYGALAALYSVSRETVRLIIKRRMWRSAEEELNESPDHALPAA